MRSFFCKVLQRKKAKTPMEWGVFAFFLLGAILNCNAVAGGLINFSGSDA
jgi:hypothetical protein